MMQRSFHLLLLAIVLAVSHASSPAAELPNIVVILTDDQGYADISLNPHHSAEVSTPNMDALAKDGVVFSQGYTSGHVCSPTRAGIMIGGYSQTVGVYTAGDGGRGFDPDEKIFPGFLPSDYVSTAIGKWHLGLDDDYPALKWHAMNRGFDECYKFMGRGGHSYFNLRSDVEGKFLHPIYRNKTRINDEGYLTNRLTEEAVDFIDRTKSKPFFLYLAYNAVHAPAEAPEADIQAFQQRYPELSKERAILMAMLKHLDDGVGEVVGKLKREGLFDNTLLFFLTDNGGSKAMSADNTPLRGFKQTLDEGGIRTPFIVSWPEKFRGGRTVDTPVISFDILPTALDAANAMPANHDFAGKSLLPLLTGKTKSHHDTLFWSKGPEDEWAVRRGQWKLHWTKGRIELIRLTKDPSETKNLATTHPDKVKALVKAYDEWISTMPDPITGGPKRKDDAATSKVKSDPKTMTPHKGERARTEQERRAVKNAAKANDSDPPARSVDGAGLPASPSRFESQKPAFMQRTAAKQRPNLLLIVSEDNSDHLGCYGEQRVHTPHLDALASDGVRYTRAYVPYSVCSPSRAAFLTGLYTRQTGHIGLATHRFSMYRDFMTMPAWFQKAGYYTGFLGKTHINPQRLVEDYVDHRAIKDANFGKTISIETYAKEARQVMENATEQGKPFLLIINYADAHRRFIGKSKHGFPTVMIKDEIEPFPWIGSDSPHLREELRNYFNCINRLDEAVGMVLDDLGELGLRDDTLVAYISDHGADFPRAKGSIYENGTRIPMIVNYPKGFSAGKVERGMVSTIDLLPTMLRAARLPTPEHLAGIPLQDIDSGRADSRKYIHTFTGGSAPSLLYMQFGTRDERYKLVYNPDRALNRLAASRYRNSELPDDQHVQSFLHPPEYELFDLKDDPHEWNNLADSEQHKATKQRLLRAMRDFQRQIRDPFLSQENIATFIAEQKEYLNKPYKFADFRWPHLKMFRQQAQETPRADFSRQTIFQRRDVPEGTPRRGHAKDVEKYAYRIPSLLVTQNDSILAFSERRLGLHDHAQNDIVLRRSTDSGETWSDEIVAFEDGMHSINDPLTVQLESGRILLMFARFPYGRHTRDSGWIKMAELGYGDSSTNVMTLICHSDDDGLTWSKPVDISRQVKHPKLLNANTPGAMIQLTKGPHKGRVVTGLWGALPVTRDGKRSPEWQIVVAYSDDNGRSWKRTPPLKDRSAAGFPNECQVAEAANGDIVLIRRNQSGQLFRKKAISRDGGETWSPIDIDRTLPSVACMGALIKGPVKDDGSWDLWASFPSDAGRKDGQIAVSKDHGRSWQIMTVIPGPFAYSALQVSPNQNSLLCLYESDDYQTETLLRIAFKELTKPIVPATNRADVLFSPADDWNSSMGLLSVSGR